MFHYPVVCKAITLENNMLLLHTYAGVVISTHPAKSGCLRRHHQSLLAGVGRHVRVQKPVVGSVHGRCGCGGVADVMGVVALRARRTAVVGRCCRLRQGESVRRSVVDGWRVGHDGGWYHRWGSVHSTSSTPIMWWVFAMLAGRGQDFVVVASLQFGVNLYTRAASTYTITKWRTQSTFYLQKKKGKVRYDHMLPPTALLAGVKSWEIPWIINYQSFLQTRTWSWNYFFSPGISLNFISLNICWEKCCGKHNGRKPLRHVLKLPQLRLV